MLTASGGPFRGRTRDELAEVTVEEALQHPTWSMGPVITINSATLVNKGLEVIEAHLLFDIPFDRIDVVVHPTSDVHSMVEFVDGSTILQASPPTMMIPIALGLAWPDRVPDAAPAFDWSTPGTWEFFPLDDEAFPAVSLARTAGELGGTAPAVYNAANEACVEAFRAGRLRFVDIIPTVDAVLAAHDVRSGADLTVDDVLAADAWARAEASASIASDKPRRTTRRTPCMTALLYTWARDGVSCSRQPRRSPNGPGRHAASRSSQAKAAAAGVVSAEPAAEDVKALDFSLDEVKEARLVPVVDFKGRRFAPRSGGAAHGDEVTADGWTEIASNESRTADAGGRHLAREERGSRGRVRCGRGGAWPRPPRSCMAAKSTSA